MIPVSAPVFSDIETINVISCLKSGWVANGDFVTTFENKWAAYCGRKHGIAVSNGTAALIAAVNALQLPPESEILIPGFTIISCALAAIYNNVKPVFVDVTEDTWTIDQHQLADKITDRTKAIMPVHMYGHPANMGHILSIANNFNLHIIEDAAQAHGATLNHLGSVHKCGSFGALSCFSFYTNKLITTGEGGMILTDDDTLAERLRNIRNLCFGAGHDRFNHSGNGNNYRLTNLQASIGVAQMERLQDSLNAKARLRNEYENRLRHLPLKWQGVRNGYTSSNWMIGIVLDHPARTLADHMRSKGIETRPFFSDLSAHYNNKPLPVASRLATHGLYLPSGVALTDNEIAQTCEAVIEYFK